MMHTLKDIPEGPGVGGVVKMEGEFHIDYIHQLFRSAILRTPNSKDMPPWNTRVFDSWTEI